MRCPRSWREGPNAMTHAGKTTATTEIRTYSRRSATSALRLPHLTAGFTSQFPHFCKRKIFACGLLNSLGIVMRVKRHGGRGAPESEPACTPYPELDCLVMGL